MDKLARQGARIFAAALAALGAMNLIFARTAEENVPVLPWLPAAAPLAIAVGIVFLLAALAFVARAQVRTAALVLAAVLTIALLVLQVPQAVAAPLDIGIRTLVFEMLSLLAAATMLVPGSTRTCARLRNGGRLLLALASIVFGVSHLLIPGFIASLIPAWMPAPLFLAWFTGFAMIAAGLGIALKIVAPLASTLLALMFFIIFTTVHMPRVLSAAHGHDPDEWSSAFICLAMVGASLLCARVMSGKPAA